MDKNISLMIAGVFFSIVALIHLLRLIFQFSVLIGGVIIPMWVSVIGLVIPLVLAVWMFRASKK